MWCVLQAQTPYPTHSTCFPVPHFLGCPWLPVSLHARHCLVPSNDSKHRHNNAVPNEQTLPLYFDRADVKAAIHAPNVPWQECSSVEVFPKGDASPPSAFSVLPSVIEKSNRTVLIHGRADFNLIAEGTRIVIQKYTNSCTVACSCLTALYSMTWGGAQGFQTPIAPDSFIIDRFGASGTSHQERGLAYYEVVLSGHMLPGYAPWVRDLQSRVDTGSIISSSRRESKACSTSWANGKTSRCMRFHAALDFYFDGREVSNQHPPHIPYARRISC